MQELYRIRFRFEYGSAPFWNGDDHTEKRFGIFIDPESLPLSEETIAEAHRLSAWHDTSLNWDYPPYPGPWRQAECEMFNALVRKLFQTAQAELGSGFVLINEYREHSEDPDLDVYLADPSAFQRRRDSFSFRRSK